MYKQTMMTLALMGMTVGVSLNADQGSMAAAVAVQKAPVAPAVSLSAEEQAFAARLNDQNRKAFVEKLTAENRKAAMAAAKTSTASQAADEAVAKFANSEIAQAPGVSEEINVQ